MTAILIDDEPDCLVVLAHKLAAYCPELKVVATFGDSVLALKEVRRLQPDIVFLDIEMPKMNGFQLLDEIGTINFTLIFTTAYNHFAVKAFKYAALDYLLKPIDPDELKSAVQKASLKHFADLRQLDLLRKQLQGGVRPTAIRVAMPYQHGYTLMETDDILYCESDGSYTRFFLKNGEIHLITRILGEVTDTLQGGDFFRIHKSWLINIKHVKQFFRNEGAYVVMSDGKNIPVARSRREDFQRLLTRL